LIFLIFFLTIIVIDNNNISYDNITGRITPRRFFDHLEGDSIIVIDESSTILSDPQIQTLLLSALQGEEVIWETKNETKNTRRY
jgi:excinuclease UvrABC helicase subunit UvrB